MITQLWGKIELYCEKDIECKMELNHKKQGIFYECPCCGNSFSLKDIEKLIDKIDDIERDADLKDETLDIKNIKIKIGHCRYKIIDNDDKLKIVGLNTKAVTYAQKS